MDDEKDGQGQELSSEVNENQEEEKREKRVEDDSSCALTNEPELWDHASFDPLPTEAQMEVGAEIVAAADKDSRRGIYGLLRSRTNDGLLGGNDSSVAATTEKEAMASRTMTSAEVHRSSSADVIQALDMVLLRHEIFLQRSALGPDTLGCTEQHSLSTSGGCAERRASSGLVEHVTTGFGCDGRRSDDGHYLTIAVVSGDALTREPR